MGKKVVTATGSDIICNYLTDKQYETVNDIPYQEGLIEFVKREFADVAILSPELSGDYDKYIFIEKIREIDSKIKIIVVVSELEDNYKSFLYSKGIFNILTDGKSLMEDLIIAIEDDEYKAPEFDLKLKSVLNMSNYIIDSKNQFNTALKLKFQRQHVIVFNGVGSTGKTTIACEFSKLLAKKTSAKILLIDLDIVNAGLNRFMGVKNEPADPGYILSPDKNSSLNYMIEAIDKRKLNANIFDRYVVKTKMYPNLDVLTGNRSLYVCKNILSSEYYSRILESAKTVYDYIVIDTSGNIFLDSMQFSLLNATKIFTISEGNYVSLERTCRLLTELFPIWGVPENKIKIVINKYSTKSLDKEIISEVLNKYEIAGFIKFSERYEEIINSPNLRLSKELLDDYMPLLREIDIGEKENVSGIKRIMRKAI